MITLNVREILPLYSILHEKQETLAPELAGLMSRIQQLLFERLSIEDLEFIHSDDVDKVNELSSKL